MRSLERNTGFERRRSPWQGRRSSRLPPGSPSEPTLPPRALRRLCSLVRCRLQNVSKTAAELGGLARNHADNLYLASCCTLGRIDELACVAALLAIWPIENSSPVHPANQRPGSPSHFGGDPGPPALRVTDCHPGVTALRRGKPEAWGCKVPSGKAIMAICLDPRSGLRQREAV